MGDSRWNLLRPSEPEERDARHPASSAVTELTHAVIVGLTHTYDDERTPPDLLRGSWECRHDDARHPRSHVLPNVPLAATSSPSSRPADHPRQAGWTPRTPGTSTRPHPGPQGHHFRTLHTPAPRRVHRIICPKDPPMSLAHIETARSAHIARTDPATAPAAPRIRAVPEGTEARGFVLYVGIDAVSYTHLRAHETDSYLVCR